MYKKLFALIKPLLKPLLIAGLVITLVFSQADGALAARGGRIGGGSFRALHRAAPMHPPAAPMPLLVVDTTPVVALASPSSSPSLAWAVVLVDYSRF